LEVLPVLGAGSLTLAHFLTAAAFRRRTGAIVAGLERTAAAEIPSSPVPPVIQSFARRAAGGTPVPKIVWLHQTGEIRADPGSAWCSFTAEQVISVHQPGFAWLARMQALPRLSAHILDCYIDGEGLLEARLFGSLPLARVTGPEVAKSELMRYLAELIWTPHAILHNPKLSWREIDATTVEVSAASVNGRARVRLIFENGDIARIEADDRPRATGRRIRPTPWQACCDDYREMEGCRIPTWATVSWVLDDGPFVCWHGRVTAYGMK